MIDDLIATAEARGYTVAWHRGGPKAAWLPHCHTITLRLGADEAHTLCALAHELGHAHYGDPPGHHGAQELRADRFAAQLLVSPSEYRTAELIYGAHPQLLATELGVTKHIIETWQQLHTNVWAA
ncbi:hypothetical protein CPHO_08550 [Corynebacterium phocae]|uniref:IrrE N-terminal-like domain-containing protein n=1 Tax=Corynebacterium phocae TaxID=161895 RepID=A0A1L7D4D3_9CORY|nr:ImmA/IrrE family metallo-endopeptidase [Corynebacterium phocae]APT92927.1 hypothetical protein CPHO_08550 [Corynebacterium phocae]KAA8723258.1 ImmA/IrrE family metallo-endopeptidase [Corynebacterium phocae]